jgi:hypothetical protein
VRDLNRVARQYHLRTSPNSNPIYGRFRHAQHALRFACLVFDGSEIDGRAWHLGRETSPMFVINAEPNVTVKARMFPLVWALHVAVLYGERKRCQEPFLDTGNHLR